MVLCGVVYKMYLLFIDYYYLGFMSMYLFDGNLVRMVIFSSEDEDKYVVISKIMVVVFVVFFIVVFFVIFLYMYVKWVWSIIFEGCWGRGLVFYFLFWLRRCSSFSNE